VAQHHQMPRSLRIEFDGAKAREAKARDTKARDTKARDTKARDTPESPESPGHPR